jgi:DNA-binding LytR/AlgR family response regulator
MDQINVLLISEQGAIQETLIYYLKKLGYTYLVANYSQSLNTVFEYFNSYAIECVLFPLNIDTRVDGVFLAQKLQHLYQVNPIFYAQEINAAQIVLLKQFSAPIYVVRPIDGSRIYVTIELVRYRYLMDQIKKRKYTQKFFFIPKGNSYLRINFADVFYIKKEQTFWRLVLVNSKAHQIYTNLNDLVKRLPPYFVRCHKDYIINMEKVLTIRPSDLVLCNETVIPVAKSYRRAILRSLSISNLHILNL